ncbi:MAG: TldD/PmbA family protein [Dehalococcoidia bacterium]|nr:TldD/PmbA family protein [Dehalococcoidia bacterium]
METRGVRNGMTIEQILERAKKVAQEAEVFYSDYHDTPVGFEANRLKNVQSREGIGVALRIIKNGRIGFAATTRLDQAEELVAAAVEIAQFGAEAKFTMPSSPGNPRPVEVYDSSVEAIPIQRMVTLGQAMIDILLQHTPEIQCECSINKRIGSLRLINSAGLDVSYRRSSFSVSIEGTFIRDTDMLFVGDRAASCRLDFDVETIARNTVEQLEMAREIVPAAVGDVPVLFTPRAVLSSLLSPLIIALNGRNVLQRSSPLATRHGEQVAAKEFTLWDDPSRPYVPGSRQWDDEGVPTQKRTLIGNGVLNGFLYDLQTAGLAGTISTGNASRSPASLPGPSMSVAIIDHGSRSKDDLIKSIGDGIVVDELIGAGQGNVLGGDFGGNLLLGYRIQNGKITGRVKNTMVAGNVYQVLKDAQLSKETEWVGGFLSAPYILCPRVSTSSNE